MKKLKLALDTLTVDTFEASDYPSVAALDTGICPDTFRTTAGPWICAAACESDSCLC
jgi:hypothetical protein